MRRVRLLFWHLFRRPPLKHSIDEGVERAAAEHCKVPWEQYRAWKREHSGLWWRYAAKRVRATKRGTWPEQPWQLRRWRKVESARQARLRSERPRFVEWAFRKLERQRSYKQTWRQHRMLDRIFFQIHGP